MKLTRKSFLAAGGLTLLGLPFGGRLLAMPDSRKAPGLRLSFFTDVHARPEPFMESALRAAARAINETKPDLIIGGGDCIHGGFTMAPGAASAHWELFSGFLRQLQAPCHIAVGNHDLVGAAPADKSSLSTNPREEILHVLGRETGHYWFSHGDWAVIILDTTEVLPDRSGYRGYFGDSQRAWLEKVLEGIPAETPHLLVSHLPLRTTFFQHTRTPTAALPPNLVVENAAELGRLFANRNLPLVLQGHLHVDEVIQWNDTTYVMGGAVCAGWWRDTHQGTGYGFQKIGLSSTVGERRYQNFHW